jgi:CO/xanthine dehydrogenase Mo-binding subunit
MKDLKIVGESVTRVDALEKVTGKAKYAIDFRIPHMLCGKLVRSPYPHARILSIDTSKAEKLPGLEVVATAKNTPPVKIGTQIMDRCLFPIDDRVRFIGDVVAAVAAENEDIALEAVDLIDVEYEELPSVFDTEEASGTNPPAIVHPDLPKYECHMPPFHRSWRLVPERPNVCHHFKIRHGDVEKGFQESDLIVENKYVIPKMNACLPEPSTCVAWFEPDGTLEVRTSTHGIWVSHQLICSGFQLPSSKVRVKCTYVGGSFGQRGYNVAEGYAVLLSKETSGRPVRVSFSREEEFINAKTRPPFVLFLKDGVKKDGTIVARQSTILDDMGAYADLAPHMVRNCTFGQVGTYRIPHFKLDAYGVYTNTPVSNPFRGIGSMETQWAVENQMNIIAEKLGLDPVEIRKKNFLKEGDRDVMGQITHSIGVNECLDKVAEWIGWNQEPPGEGGPWKRGKGISVGNKYSMLDAPSSALVKVHPDGTIEVRHSSGEIGMGINTVAAQIVAEEFGINIDCVRVVSGDTAVVPYGQLPVSQRETFTMGNALLMACQDAKRQLFEIAAPKLGVSAEQLEVRDRKIYVKWDPREKISVSNLFSPPGEGYAHTKAEIIGKAVYVCPGVPEDPETGQSPRMSAHYGYGAYGVEVGVNVDTGEVKVIRSGGCFDVGKAINPKMCEGQIEGGISMGIGTALYEQMVLESGMVLNPNYMDYKVPTITEMPTNGNLKVWLIGVPHREGPYGAKGAGEGPTIAYPPAIAHAVHNAIGIWVKDPPLTREKILKGLREKELK